MTLEYGYDDYDRLTEVIYPEPGYAVFHEYDIFGYHRRSRSQRAPCSMADAAIDWEWVEADPAGNVKVERAGNGAETTRYYQDGTYRPDGIQTVAPGSGPSLQSLTYVWSDGGDLQERTDGNVGQSETFSYDDAHRLRTWTWGGSTRETQYDVLGNITYKSGQGTYAYDAATDRLNSVGANAYSYDDNGNALSDGERTLTWTAQNKVRSLNRAGDAWSLLYDADGTRVVREEAAANEATYNVSPNYELRFEGTTLSQAKISVLGTTGRVVAEVVADRTELAANERWENTKSFVHDDHLGSTHTVTDREAAVVSRVMYGPWGRARDGDNWYITMDEAALEDLPTGFTGHQPELDAGLINMRGRMYDPEVGRFMSVDPVIEDALEVGTWNAYSYVQNRPLSLVDPTGLASEGPPPGAQPKLDPEAFLAERGFVGADYRDVEDYYAQNGFWVPWEAQTHGPRVEDEVAKSDAGDPVEATSYEWKTSGDGDGKTGTYGAVKGAVDAMLCQNAPCLEVPEGEQTEPGRAIEAGAYGLAAYSALLIGGVVVALLAPEAAAAAGTIYEAGKAGVLVAAGALSSASARCSSAGGAGCSASPAPQEISKRTWSHILNKHTFDSVARQLPNVIANRGTAAARAMVNSRDFFPKEWSPAQVRAAVQATYQAGLANGVAGGRFALEVSRHTVTVFISETGGLQSAWGSAVYKAADFGL